MKEQMNYVPQEVIGKVDRDKQSDRIVRLLEKVKAREFFGNEESKKDFIKKLDFESFKKWLISLNGNLQDVPIAKRSYNGGEMELRKPQEAAGTFTDLGDLMAGGGDDLNPPRQADREALFHKLYECVQEMARDDRLMEDIALEAGLGINAIHAFSDGNGRTSRLVHFLLSEDYQGTEEQNKYLRKLLGDKGRLQLNLDPHLAQNITDAYLLKRMTGLDAREQTSIKDSDYENSLSSEMAEDLIKDFLKYITPYCSYGSLSYLAVYQYLKDSQKLEGCLKEGTKGIISWEEMDACLDQKGVSQILSNYWALKKESVSVLLEAVALPVPEKYAASIYDEMEAAYRPTNIKDEFLKELAATDCKSHQEVNGQGLEPVWSRFKAEPFTQDKIPPEEMSAMREIRAEALKMIDKDTQERAALNFDSGWAEAELEKMREAASQEIAEGDRQGWEKFEDVSFDKKRDLYAPLLAVSEKNLQAFVLFLEKFSLWTDHFSTRNKYLKISEERKASTDSEYFVTPSGCSLRLLKYYLAEEGLKTVIQPFMEKIIYLDEEDKNQGGPKIGLNPVEYATEEFWEALKGPRADGYVSRIKNYTIDGETYYLNPNDGDMHEAYPIVAEIKKLAKE